MLFDCIGGYGDQLLTGLETRVWQIVEWASRSVLYCYNRSCPWITFLYVVMLIDCIGGCGDQLLTGLETRPTFLVFR
jgi:hypothetical protein